MTGFQFVLKLIYSHKRLWRHVTVAPHAPVPEQTDACLNCKHLHVYNYWMAFKLPDSCGSHRGCLLSVMVLHMVLSI